jgi:DNA-binding CsgD family transcriptional regulator
MYAENNSSKSFYNEFLSVWEQITQTIEGDDINKKYEETSMLMGQFAAINNQIITIYNMKDQKVLYISDTYHTVSGYKCTIEEYKKWSSVYWMRDLPLAQSWFMIQMSLWFKTSMQPKIKKYEGTKSLHFYLHNFVLSPPESDRKHPLSLVVDTLEIGTNGSPVVFLIVKKDINSLIKNDGPWWAEFCFNGNERYYYHQEERKFKSGSILTDREAEVLLLIKAGMDTKQIAEALNISTHTIDKHRKNMLERTGAKDTSCLIQICDAGRII